MSVLSTLASILWPDFVKRTFDDKNSTFRTEKLPLLKEIEF